MLQSSDSSSLTLPGTIWWEHDERRIIRIKCCRIRRMMLNLGGSTSVLCHINTMTSCCLLRLWRGQNFDVYPITLQIIGVVAHTIHHNCKVGSHSKVLMSFISLTSR